MKQCEDDTITALATPPGKGGIAIVRVSGSKAPLIAEAVLGFYPQARKAHYGGFFENTDTSHKQLIDKGVAIYFASPNSFTGEDVVEFQGHGGDVISHLVLKETLRLGARLAEPGEFSQRAFLNGKIDLTQAEAIADLINSSSEEAARSAVRSLEGAFKSEINALVEQLTQLRCYVESAIDFPEEEINFLADEFIISQLKDLHQKLQSTLDSAQQGAILRNGLNIVIVGKPNAGKSSLLNSLSGKDSAIVTEIQGTTRDIIRESIHLNGVPLHVFDTAGLRDSSDPVEKEGIRRARAKIDTADLTIIVADSTADEGLASLISQLELEDINQDKVVLVNNKCDISQQAPGVVAKNQINLSAKTGVGVDILKQYLLEKAGYFGDASSSTIARERHLTNLNTSLDHLNNAHHQLTEYQAGELVAEELRNCQQQLGEITGTFTSDDLLGRIFSSFCIGK